MVEDRANTNGRADVGRSALIVAHTSRSLITRKAAFAAEELARAGFEVRMLAREARDCGSPSVVTVPEEASAAENAELVLVFGGDGTFLRAAEFARPARVPMLGVNFGRVGFLAEAEPDALAEAMAAVVERRYDVEERTTLDVWAELDGEPFATGWSLNEVSVEKSSRERMLELAVAVDGRALLHFGCDGVLCATPTGSTAYAYSAGGPILWPSLDAILVVPNAAHALFSRPIVVTPESQIDVELLRPEYPGVMSCDGRRSVDLPPGTTVIVRRGAVSIRIVRLSEWSFAERLVAKFQLPVASFRGGRTDLGPDD
jgi:NAD+ kinase